MTIKYLSVTDVSKRLGISTAAVSRITRVCHGTLEKFVLLISVKNCSGSVLISEPVSAPNALRSTQPTMMA